MNLRPLALLGIAGLLAGLGCGAERPIAPGAPSTPDSANLPMQLAHGGSSGGRPGGGGVLPPVHPENVILEFEGPIPSSTFFEQNDLEVVRTYGPLPLVLVRSVVDISSEDLEEDLRVLAEVRSAEADPKIETAEGLSMTISFDDGFTWSDFADQDFAERMNVPQAHAMAKGAGTRVAILDTGIDPTHPQIAARYRGGLDLIDGDEDPTDEKDEIDNDEDGFIDEGFGHGTHVAGIVNLLAPDTDLYMYRVLNSDGVGYGSNVPTALVRAVLDEQVHVINLSLGLSESFRALEVACEWAEDQGVVLIASAGNLGVNTPQPPASLASVAGVGSVDAADHLSWFSNWGEPLEITAPGEGIVSAYPGDKYVSWSGTSMSAPMVSALAALYLSAGRSGTPLQVREHLATHGVATEGMPNGRAVDRADFMQALLPEPEGPGDVIATGPESAGTWRAR